MRIFQPTDGGGIPGSGVSYGGAAPGFTPGEIQYIAQDGTQHGDTLFERNDITSKTSFVTPSNTNNENTLFDMDPADGGVLGYQNTVTGEISGFAVDGGPIGSEQIWLDDISAPTKGVNVQANGTGAQMSVFGSGYQDHLNLAQDGSGLVFSTANSAHSAFEASVATYDAAIGDVNQTAGGSSVNVIQGANSGISNRIASGNSYSVTDLGNGGNLVLSANSQAFAYADSTLGQDILMISNNSGHPQAQLGAIAYGNHNFLDVNDSSGQVSVYGFGNTAGDRSALFNNGSKSVTLGDVDGDFSGTTLKVDDMLQQYLFSKPNFSIASVPYSFPLSQGTANTVLTNDGSGVLSWSAPVVSSLSWGAITGTPTTLAGYGITDPVVLTSGSYSDPSWITSLAYSKLTGAPVAGVIQHTVFTPTTGSTVNLAKNQYSAVNPSGAILALTLNFPSSPSDGDFVEVKFDKGVTTVTYSGGTVLGGITTAALGDYAKFVYDSGTASWY